MNAKRYGDRLEDRMGRGRWVPGSALNTNTWMQLFAGAQS